MKKSEIQELKNRSRAELEKLMKEARERLWALRMDLAAGKVKNIAELSGTKKKIARIQTILNAPTTNQQ